MAGRMRILGGILLAAIVCATTGSALGASAREVNRDATAALQKLYASSPSAKTLAASAKGVLISRTS